jgi:hypothetical protein
MSTATELLRLVVHEITAYGQVTYKTLEQIENSLAAESEAEPVAWLISNKYAPHSTRFAEVGEIELNFWRRQTKWTFEPLYLHPPNPSPSRKPMTEEEIDRYLDNECLADFDARIFKWAISIAEKHHGIGEDWCVVERIK